MISFVKNRWIPSSLVDVGPDSDSLDVEADLVEIRGSMFPPPVGIFCAYTGPVIVGNIVSAAVVQVFAQESRLYVSSQHQ